MWPYIIAAALVILAMTVLFGRLWYLQLFKADYYAGMSEGNRIRLQDVAPIRGRIYDRNGVLLVDNQPAFDLAVVKEDVADMEALVVHLNTLLDLDPDEVRAVLRKKRSTPPFMPITIKTDLNRDEVARVETYKYELPGLTLLTEPKRYYLFPSLASHVIGYTGEVTARQLKSPRYEGSRPGDRVGQYGIEMAANQALAGRHGGRQVEVDATGRPLKVLQQVPAKPGRNLYLTIDARLQRTAEEALSGKAGAIVALDVNTGQVLAMASSPSFDQYDFVRGLSPERWRDLIKDPLHPLDNRAISGQYPPGSTYKMVVALAALMEGVIPPETTIYCPGHYRFAGRNYGCWKKGGHGEVNLHRSLVESCDVYYYRVGQKLGVDRIAKYARLLGLGSKTGIEIAGEKPGLIPTTKWKRKRLGEKWHEGETLSISIGQGFDLTTPLQVARMAAVVANGGRLITPTLIRRVEAGPEPEDGSPQAETGDGAAKKAPAEPPRVEISARALAMVRAALTDVVEARRGTGKRARVKGVKVAGKTGTSQVIRLDKFKHVKDIEDIPYKYRDHAWFVSFAPADKPEIAVAVIAEHSGGGGRSAAPLAGQVLKRYFDLQKADAGGQQTPVDPDKARPVAGEEVAR